jgi:hypothetical protein
MFRTVMPCLTTSPNVFSDIYRWIFSSTPRMWPLKQAFPNTFRQSYIYSICYIYTIYMYVYAIYIYTVYAIYIYYIYVCICYIYIQYMLYIHTIYMYVYAIYIYSICYIYIYYIYVCICYIYISRFPAMRLPQNGWFLMEIPIKMDDLYIF